MLTADNLSSSETKRAEIQAEIIKAFNMLFGNMDDFEGIEELSYLLNVYACSDDAKGRGPSPNTVYTITHLMTSLARMESLYKQLSDLPSESISLKAA